MNNKQTLYSQIKRFVMPKLMLALCAFVVSCCLVYFYTGIKQLESQHKSHVNQLTANISTNINNVVNTVEGLSRNDLLINGLIDFQMRDEYLPLFFQSLKMAKSENTSSVLFDFSGEIIMENNWLNNGLNTDSNNWQNITLEKGETYQYFGKSGLLVISPILMFGMPEGALGLYIPSISLLADTVINTNIQQYIFDDNGALLYSTETENKPASYQNFSDNNELQFIYETQWRNFKVVSAQSYTSGYSESIWLLPFLIIAVLGTLFSCLFSMKLSSKKASDTVKNMHERLVIKSNNLTKSCCEVESEAIELQQIQRSFDDLLDKVMSLSLSNDKITNVINSLQALLLVVDNEGNIILSNCDSDELFSTGYISQKSIIEEGLRGVNDRGFYSFTTRLKQKENIRTIEWEVNPFLDQDENHIGAIFNGEDVSLRLSLQKDVNLRNQALEISPAAITIADVSQPSAPLVYVNKAFTKITGYTSADAVGKNCNFLRGKATEEPPLATIKQALDALEPCQTTITNYKKNGEPFINSLSLQPVIELDGSVKYFVGVQQDITIEKQTETYLADARNKAEEIAKAQSRFFAGINHELRTPINGINGMVKALLKSQLTEQQRKQAELANLSANNLLLIVNDVLDYSKAESGQLSIESSTFDITSLLNGMSESYALQCKNKGLSFKWTGIPTSKLNINSDKLRLQQILDNLVGNAIKFTESGQINITTDISDIKIEKGQKHKNKINVEFAVQDTGIGIPADQIDNIFKMFGQVESNSRKVNSGTGLGLNISQQLINLMGGKLSVKSRFKRGSEFSFNIVAESILIEKEDNAETTMPNKISIDKRQSNSDELLSPTPIVLVVEDNEINQAVVMAALPHARKLIAANGLKALDILNAVKAKVDVILMDCQMPELDGWETTRLIRDGHATNKYKDIPVIALTAYTALKDQQECSDAGMNDYVSKPFDPDVLIEKVNYWTQVSRQTNLERADIV